MEEVSRRLFFKRAGSAAAVAAVATVTPVGLTAVAGAEPKVPELKAHEELTTGENLVAHVRDAKTGEISLFIGQKEVTIHDRQIATRLIRATR